jgi:uncharacterized protein
VIAIDTNVLIYARRSETRLHAPARDLLKELAESASPWAIPWPCIYEFLRVITHPRVFHPPTTLETALEDLESILESPSLVLLGEGSRHSAHLVNAIRKAETTGNLIHDAHIAALVAEHGVTEILTTDRDFARFHHIRSRNPFIDVEGVREKAPGYRLRRRRAVTA